MKNILIVARKDIFNILILSLPIFAIFFHFFDGISFDIYFHQFSIE